MQYTPLSATQEATTAHVHVFDLHLTREEHAFFSDQSETTDDVAGERKNWDGLYASAATLTTEGKISRERHVTQNSCHSASTVSLFLPVTKYR